MNVEIGSEAAQFLEKEYINGIFDAVQAILYRPCHLEVYFFEGELIAGG